MNTAFRESFDADLSVIRNVALLRRIQKVIEQGVVTFVRCLDRKEIYRYFP